MSNFVTRPKRLSIAPAQPELLFRVFYDPDTGVCVSKTDGDTEGQFPFLEVSYQVYTGIDVCSNYVVRSGKLEKIKRPSKYKKIQMVQNGQFKTIKGNMIFTVNNNYKGDVDTWDFLT